MYQLSPRAAGVAAHPLPPELITVPGDPSTPGGSRYASTYGNDFRQLCEWSPAHELQLLHLIATAKPVAMRYMEGTKQRSKIVNVPAETVAVFLQTVPKKDATLQTFEAEDGSHFDVVADDGRQRRLDAIVGNARLKWIADTFVLPIWADESDPEKRRIALRNRLVEYGPDGKDSKGNSTAAKMVKGASLASLPPLPPGVRPPHEGEVLAPWLSVALVEKLTGTVNWFNSDGEAVCINLRPDIRGEDVDLGNVNVLVDNLRGKEANVATPMKIKAMQYAAALDAKDPITKEPRYTVASLAAELNTATANITHALDYLKISDEVRDAVDRNHRGEGGVSLKLAVTGRECICFGYDKSGDRHLLNEKQQLSIWGELLKAFSVEDGEGGIPDNKGVRKILAKIKADVLGGTKFDPTKTPAKKPTKADEKVAAAAKRAGVTLDEKPPAAPSSRSHRPYASSTTPVPPPAPATSTIRLVNVDAAKIDIRDKLTKQAASWRINLTTVSQNPDDRHERALVVGAAMAVAAYYKGDSSLLCRFPALEQVLEGRGNASSKTPAPAPASESSKTPAKSSRSSGRRVRAAYTLKRSPFAIQEDEQVNDTIEAALSRWEADGGDSDEDSEKVYEAIVAALSASASEVLGEGAEPEFLVKCIEKLRSAVNDYEDEDLTVTDEKLAFPKRWQRSIAGHIREYLFTGPKPVGDGEAPTA